jgi:predicted TIM-barrel fold metal-dependent hydrolase
MQFGTEDHLMVGTDYGHNDRSTDLRALQEIQDQGERGEIPADVARKILDDNPRRFYGL